MALASPAPANTPPGTAVDADLANADAAAEALLAQSRNGGQSLKPDVSPERDAELDKAFAEATGTEPAKTAPSAEEIGRDNNGVKRKLEGAPSVEEEKAAADAQKLADDKVAADKAAADAEAERKTAADPAKTDAGKRKGLLGDVIEDDKAANPDADDPNKAYDNIKLRPDASDKTKETFANQRALAIQRETAVKTLLDAEKAKRVELESRITELEKTAGKPDEPTAAELKELREFRAVHDVAARPEFKEKFDARLAANEASIYDFFKKEGMPDARIAELKKLSEDQRDAYFEKHVYPNLTPGQRRFVESKLVDNVTVAEEKKQALAQARAESDKILSEQREAPKKQLIARDTAIANVIKPILNKLPYIHLMEVPDTATDAEKKQIAEHNAFATELQGNLRTAIIDDSPEVRAESALAVPISRYLSRTLKTVTAERDALKAQLAAIDAASATGSRLGRSAALPGKDAAPAPAAKSSDDSGDVIDALFAANQKR